MTQDDEVRLSEFLREQLSEISMAKQEEITDETHLYRDLAFDSLDVIELAMALEEEFYIDVDDQEMVEVATVGELYKTIKRTIEQQGMPPDSGVENGKS